MAILAVTCAGCLPQQPHYLFEKGDSDAYYIGEALKIEYPDVDSVRVGDVEGAIRPLSLQNREPGQIWDLGLEEAIHIGLANSKVLRNLGGSVSLLADSAVPVANPNFTPTVYDPAIADYGVQNALSEFDATLTSSLGWQKNTDPQNIAFLGFLPRVQLQDAAAFKAQIQKWNPTGGYVFAKHDVNYDYQSQTTSRIWPTDWTTQLEIGFNQPLLQGAGVQVNRIAGQAGRIAPAFSGVGSINIRNQQYSPGRADGVIINRINTDITLTEFEEGVRNLVHDIEESYWELYLGYRKLDAVVAGRDSALQTWRKIYELFKIGAAGGEAEKEAQAREQYFLFRSSVETQLHQLYQVESKLRYLMGIAPTDGRLIRPADEPNTARIDFDFADIKCEALARRCEIRRLKWHVKKWENELIVAKNFTLPTLNGYGTYRWNGLGPSLLDSTGGSGSLASNDPNAYQVMTSGHFQSWELGVLLEIPIGYRKEHAGVRTAQMQLARVRALLQEAELDVLHQVTDAIRDVESQYEITKTNFNRRLAAKRQVEAVEAAYETETVTLDLLLEAQRRLAQAESDYFESLVLYTKAITDTHYYKGSLLEYNAVLLAEGPWPGKAYFDARRRARARSAALYMDYGYTRPRVVSRGEYDQHAGAGIPGSEVIIEEGGLAPIPATPIIIEGSHSPTLAPNGPSNGEMPEVIEAPQPVPRDRRILTPGTDDQSSTAPPAGWTQAPEGAPVTSIARRKDGWSAAPTGTPSGGLDVARLDLARLSQHQDEGGDTQALQPVSFQQPADSGWTNNATRATQATAATDRSTSGWSAMAD